MKFGPVPLADAEGAILAHAAKLDGGQLPKGHRLTVPDLRRLEEAGLSDIVAACLDDGDLSEDDAAERLSHVGGSAVKAGPAGTGRVNFFAEAADRGWGCDLVLFRGCNGEPNRARRFYHSGETSDMSLFV